MMQCRAKMIDGSPVTFDWIDHGGLRWVPSESDNSGWGAPYFTEMVGHGFEVWSMWRGYSQDTPYDRIEADRRALERSGIDTATVERWEPEVARLPTGVKFSYADCWVPVFPPVLKEAPASLMPGMITYINAEPTAEMMDAGMAEGMACWAQSIGNRETVRRVWCAMEKTRR